MAFRTEKDFITKAGLRAVVLVVQYSQGIDRHRCGYVGVPPENLLYGKGYSEDVPELKSALEKAKEGPVGKRGIVSVFCHDGESANPGIIFDVHGGLTYSGGSEHGYPAESGLWWFGFDAAHSGDGQMNPDAVGLRHGYEPVRSLEYMEQECENLAAQIAEVTGHSIIAEPSP